MGQAEVSQAFNTQKKVKTIGVTGLAVALAIAGAILAFTSVQADARPNYVTAKKPCGSCHPPNKPPKRK
jgi:hypothetical protein